MTQIHTPREWRTIALTSSNRTLADVLERGGMQWDPSHGVRFIEIPITNAFSDIPEGLFPAQFAKDWLAKLAGPTGRRCTGSWTSSRHRSPPLQRRQRSGNGSRQKLQQCEREFEFPIRWRGQPSRIIFCAYRNSWPNSGRRWDFAGQPARGKRRGRARLDGLKSGYQAQYRSALSRGCAITSKCTATNLPTLESASPETPARLPAPPDMSPKRTSRRNSLSPTHSSKRFAHQASP